MGATVPYCAHTPVRLCEVTCCFCAKDRLTILKAAELRKQYIAAEKATGDAFNDMDKNQDGKIDREEWVAKYGNDEQFNLFDLDENGCIDMDEFKHGRDWAKSQSSEITTLHRPIVQDWQLQTCLPADIDIYNSETGLQLDIYI